MTLTEPFFLCIQSVLICTQFSHHSCVCTCYSFVLFLWLHTYVSFNYASAAADYNDGLSNIITSFYFNLVNSLFYFLSSGSYKNNMQCEAIQHCFVHSPVLQWNKVELNESKESVFSLQNYDDYYRDARSY